MPSSGDAPDIEARAAQQASPLQEGNVLAAQDQETASLPGRPSSKGTHVEGGQVLCPVLRLTSSGLPDKDRP